MAKLAIHFRLPSGAVREARGREAETIAALVDAGPLGITSLEAFALVGQCASQLMFMTCAGWASQSKQRANLITAEVTTATASRAMSKSFGAPILGRQQHD